MLVVNQIERFASYVFDTIQSSLRRFTELTPKESYFAAAEKGNLDEFLEAEKKWPMMSELIDSTTEKGETLLVLAIKSNNLELVRYLIGNGYAEVNQESAIFSIDERDRTVGTPLHAAVMTGNLDIVKYLIEDRNVDLTTLSNSSETVRWFPPSLSAKFYEGKNSTLHYAAYYLQGKTRNAIVQYLTEKETDMWIRNQSGKFPWEMIDQFDGAMSFFTLFFLCTFHDL